MPGCEFGAQAGNLDGSAAIIIDDLISTGGTLLGAAKACRQQGAHTVYAAATHGVFVGGAERLFSAAEIDNIVVSDTIPPLRLEPSLLAGKLVTLSSAGLVTQAIEQIHTGGSLVELLE